MKKDLNDFYFSTEAKEKLNNPQLMVEELNQGKVAQEILRVPDRVMAQFYKAAYELFEEKRYQDASHAFLFLVTLNPDHHEYWLGLGMATQLNQDYESAIDAYEIAALCDISSPVPYFYLAKCLFAIHDRESALHALDLAIETAAETEEYKELKEQAQLAKDILLKNEHQ
ncbi:MAG: SycD/LcrH family type III secretion system chaperone [Parachlamydiaceae bacterium]